MKKLFPKCLLLIFPLLMLFSYQLSLQEKKITTYLNNFPTKESIESTFHCSNLIIETYPQERWNAINSYIISIDEDPETMPTSNLDNFIYNATFELSTDKIHSKYIRYYWYNTENAYDSIQDEDDLIYLCHNDYVDFIIGKHTFENYNIYYVSTLSESFNTLNQDQKDKILKQVNTFFELCT